MTANTTTQPLPLLSTLKRHYFALHRTNSTTELQRILRPRQSIIVINTKAVNLRLTTDTARHEYGIAIVRLTTAIVNHGTPPPIRHCLLRHRRRTNIHVLLGGTVRRIISNRGMRLALRDKRALRTSIIVCNVNVDTGRRLTHRTGLSATGNVIVSRTYHAYSPTVFTNNSITVAHLSGNTLRHYRD